MKEHLRELVAGADAAAARNRVREHLQVAILRSLQGAGAMLSLAFVGGTALRVLYRLPRFSEDLDFCLVHDKTYDLRRYLDAVLSDLKRQGYAPEVARLRDARTVQAAFVRFPDLLTELGVAQPRTKALAIRVEVDTNPAPGAVLETTLVRPRDVALRLRHHDPASLLAGKLHAILDRQHTKGRDYYDLAWYLSSPTWPEPNLPLLNAALEQTGWNGPTLGPTTWAAAVAARVRAVDWATVRADVAPFLEQPQDATLADRRDLLKLLGARGRGMEQFGPEPGRADRER